MASWRADLRQHHAGECREGIQPLQPPETRGRRLRRRRTHRRRHVPGQRRRSLRRRRTTRPAPESPQARTGDRHLALRRICLSGHLVRKEGETVKLTYLNTASIATLLLFAGAAHAETFNIPSGDLKSALDAYARQTGVNLIVAGVEVTGVRTKGVQGDFSTDSALSHLLSGTGFSMHRRASGAIGIMRDQSSDAEQLKVSPIQLAQTAPPRAVETVTVTSSKLGGADVQSIPIAITALSQEQLTSSQTAGGPDLVKQVPNLTFSKTNFSG